MPLFAPPSSLGYFTVTIGTDVSAVDKKFMYLGFPANNILQLKVFAGTLGDTSYYIPYAGSIISTVIAATSPITAGTLIIRPTVNGILLGSDLLDSQLDIVNTIFHDRITADGNFPFPADSYIGLQATSSIGLLPITDIRASVYLKLTIP